MMITIFFTFLGSSLLLFLAKYLYKSWWYPIYIQKMMNSQGIRGEPYGKNIKISDMEMKSSTSSMELSHDIFPILQPRFYSGIKLYGRNFIIWHGSKPELVVTDVNLIKEILNNKEGSIAKRKLSGPLKTLFGNGVLFSEGPKWSKLRKVSDYAFHSQNLKDMIPAMIESADEMLKTWKSYERKEIEVYEQFRLLSSEIISKTAFGSSYLEGKDIFQMLDKLTLLVYMSFQEYRIPIIGEFIRTSGDIESDKIRDDLRESIMSMVKKREDNVKTGQTESYGSDFLGSLLKAHHDADEKTRITVDDIIDECKTFYFAGHETTTNVLSWTVLLLAIHTDWQDKAREEVLELFGREIPTTDIISSSRLDIVGMILNESLRLYPAVIDFARRVTKKTRIGELTLPAGIDLNIPPLSIHHNSEIWGDDALIFKPERFAEGVAKATRNQLMAFLAFGFGVRKCVGMSFAMMESKIALSMILQRYRFTLSPNYCHSPTVHLSVRPKQGIQIMLHPL